MSERPLRLGVAGLGRAFTIMLPTLSADPRFVLTAGCDPRAEARDQLARDFGARVYPEVAALCADPDLDAIYIATPHQMHAEHVALAAAHGHAVLVEKPMAISLRECSLMIDACERAGVALVVGHSHSFDAPIARARRLIEAGLYGPVRMITALDFTDYMYRPRRPEEMDTAQGGGVLFSQAAHQVDIVRLLGGGQVLSVRAQCAAWDPARPTEGAYSALLRFANGAFASLTYSGYGHFDSDEFCGGIGEMGIVKNPASYGAARRRLASLGAGQSEAELKAQANYGGRTGPGAVAAPGTTAPATDGGRLHQHFGPLIVSCERADLRPLPGGVMIHADERQWMDALPPPLIPRIEVMDEFHAAVTGERAPVHDGRWARATLEVCLAMLQSAHEQREIELSHQVAIGQ